MAILGIKVPHEVSRALGRFDVPGEKIQFSRCHITLLHLGTNIPIETVTRAIVAAYEVSSKAVPFSLLLEQVSCFPEGDDGVPVIIRVQSPELHQLWKDLRSSLDKAGIDYSKKFPEFKPHVTLSYNDSPIRPFPIGPLEWSTYEMVLWGGESGDDRLSVTLPFSMPGKEALLRTLVQARVRFPARA